MNYYGIVLIGYDLYVCKKIADNLNIVEDFKFVPELAQTDMEKCGSIENYIEYIESQKLVYKSFTSDKRIQFDKWRYIFDMNDIKQRYLINEIPVMIIPEEFLISFFSLVERKRFIVIRIDNQETSTAIIGRRFNQCTYRIVYNNIDDVCNLIIKLWQYRNVGGALSRDMIEKMMKCGMLIRNCDYDSISHASYDLTLGDEYYYNGKVRRLDNKQPFIPVEPYDYIIASSNEMLAFPRDVSGRFDLVVNLFFEGIILSNSTQVDPGFNGKLFCLLFNTSNKTVYLKRGMPFSTLEFNKLIEPTDGYNGRHAYEESMVSYLPRNIMNGAINELKKEVEALKKENSRMQQIYLTSLAIMIATLALLKN